MQNMVARGSRFDIGRGGEAVILQEVFGENAEAKERAH